MAPTSPTSDRPERESANISQETALSPSISAVPSHPSLCSSCFAWVSFFNPWHSVQYSSRASTSNASLNQKKEVGIAPSTLSSAYPSKSMASTSTTGRKQDNEVIIGTCHGNAPLATTSASIPNSMTTICTADLKRDNAVKMGAFQESVPVAPTSSSQSYPKASKLTAGLKQKNKVNIDYFPSQSNSMGSTSDLKHESEVNTGCSHGNVSYATTSASESSSMPSASAPGLETKNEYHGNAFDGIAPPPPATTLTEEKSFDVFLNHRGPDVKDKLATNLHSILKNKNLSVFLDSKETDYGEFLPATITSIMSSALFHIAIFSLRYAESAWCLAELAFMLTTGAPIIPIFYHVDPSDLRWVEKGKYAQDFKVHEGKGRYKGERIQEWKTALHNVSFYYGPIIRNDEDEKRLLKKIVDRVSILLETVPLVGLDEIVKDFTTAVECAGGDDGVQVVGIWGVGGSGKTTLAKELHRRKCSYFKDKSSIVVDVRDGQMHKQQLRILSDLHIHGVACDSEDRGIEILSSRLTSMRVLIVIDGVDKVDHLNALLPAKDRLGKGSVVIVTSRTCDVLQSWGVSSTYEMKLDRSYAKKIFCYEAFLKPCSPNRFDDLVDKFVDKCNKLPLRLKLLGRQLRGVHSTESWNSLLREFPTLLLATIEKSPKASFDYLEYEDAKVEEKLKEIYDALDHKQKEMFLDTACFFVEEEKSLAIEVWNGLGLNGLDGLNELVKKNLVELDDDNCIRMNDSVQDFGRKRASQQTPYRLLPSQHITNVENQEEQRTGIRGIMAITTQKQWNYFKGRKPFPVTIDLNDTVNEIGVRCSHGELTVTTNQETLSLQTSSVGLNFFAIRGDHFYQSMGAVSGELVWLRWSQIGKQKLPPQLSLKKLRVLELLEGNKKNLEELWGETEDEAPDDLRELIISQCFKFQCFPRSIRRLNHLKKIVLIKSHRVKHLPDEFCQLRSLEYLVLYNCRELESLPTDFGQLRELRHLCLSGCGDLTRLPISFRNLINLEYLNLRGCELTPAPEISEILDKLLTYETN